MPSNPGLRRLASELPDPIAATENVRQTEDSLASLDDIYRTQAPRLTRFFRGQLRETEEPQDLVQEAFARLASFMSRHPLTNPGPYLHSIARNLLFERARRRARRMTSFHVPIGEGCDPTVDPDQAHRIEAKDVMRIYQRALDELPEKTRAIFLLHRVEELTYKAIGEQIGVSIPTVQYHVSRALAHIDAALDQE
jgi:RNA polymerase sigma factor (sigma-70 family)